MTKLRRLGRASVLAVLGVVLAASAAMARKRPVRSSAPSLRGRYDHAGRHRPRSAIRQRLRAHGGHQWTPAEYRFAALPPARYSCKPRSRAFKTYLREIDVALGRTVTNDFVMGLGAVTDVIRGDR